MTALQPRAGAQGLDVTSERSGTRQVADLQLEGIPDDVAQGVSAAPVSPCPWCGANVMRIERGGHVKEFCSKAHKNAYNAALTKLAIFSARLMRTPGELKTWSLCGVNPWPSENSAPEAPKRRN